MALDNNIILVLIIAQSTVTDMKTGALSNFDFFGAVIRTLYYGFVTDEPYVLI